MLKKALALAALAAALGSLSAPPASAQDGLYVPLFTYRTGPFSGSGTFIANGMRDYLTMLNERDGGIGGVKLVIEECETGYDTKKGLGMLRGREGQEARHGEPVVHGRDPAADPARGGGQDPGALGRLRAFGLGRRRPLPWIFNPPNTYWDGAAAIIKYIGDQEGGIDKLKGKKIGYLYLDAGFGKEPIPLLEQLAKDYGFELKMYPVAGTEMQNQSSQWLGVRRDRPNYMIMYGWGAMNPTALKEAVKINYPMDKFISIWWPSEDDARGAGGAKGFKTLNWHATGAEFPAMQDVIKFVVDKGKSQAPKEHVGEVLYNRGVYNSMLIAEGIASAQKVTGKKMVTGEDVRRGLEAMDLSTARLKELGFEGFAEPIKMTCQDHNGQKAPFLQEFDGKVYRKITQPIEPMREKVRPIQEAAAKDYVEKNPSWPKRTEACEKAS